MLTAYPVSLAPEDWALVQGLLSGQVPTTVKAIHCCWDAVGFCLGKAYPDDTSSIGRSKTMEVKEALNHVTFLTSFSDKLHLTPSQWIALAQTILQILAAILTPTAPVA